MPHQGTPLHVMHLYALYKPVVLASGIIWPRDHFQFPLRTGQETAAQGMLSLRIQTVLDWVAVFDQGRDRRYNSLLQHQQICSQNI